MRFMKPGCTPIPVPTAVAPRMPVAERLRNACDLGSSALKQGRVPGQALSEGERHRVLKARPADADHGAEGFHALPDCRLQRGEGVQQAAGFAVQDKGGRRGKHVVGGLAHIDVGIGMDAIRALVPGQQLVGAVPQHLVDVHVDGCPAASNTLTGN